MEKMQKIVRDFVKVGVIVAAGLAPKESVSQNTIDSLKINNEKLTSQIFNEVKLGTENGSLKNSERNAYYFNFKNDTYNISCIPDLNNDNEKSAITEIGVKEGNSHFVLKEDQRNDEVTDLVFNYKDSISGWESKPYDEFSGETNIVIGDLVEDQKHIVNYRETTPEEKTKIFEKISKIIEENSDNNSVKNNIINIKKAEEIKLIESKEKETEMHVLESGQKILKYLKENDLKDKLDQRSTIIKGSYSYEFCPFYLKIKFTDENGDGTLIDFRLSGDNLSYQQSKIQTQDEQKLKDFSISKVLEIINNSPTK